MLHLYMFQDKLYETLSSVTAPLVIQLVTSLSRFFLGGINYLILIKCKLYFLGFLFAGKKKSPSRVVYDYDVADGLVDLDKLSSNMQNTLDRLKQDYMTKVTVRILPSEY